jgi:hypothetical protein
MELDRTTPIMQITVEIPDEIAQRLNQTEGNLSHRLYWNAYSQTISSIIDK